MVTDLHGNKVTITGIMNTPSFIEEFLDANSLEWI